MSQIYTDENKQHLLPNNRDDQVEGAIRYLISRGYSEAVVRCLSKHLLLRTARECGFTLGG